MRGGSSIVRHTLVHSFYKVCHAPAMCLAQGCGSARVSRCCLHGHPRLAGTGPALTHKVAPAALPEPQGREGGRCKTECAWQVFVFIHSSSFIRVLRTGISALAAITSMAGPQRQTL